MPHPFSRRSAFTVIELLIALALFSIVVSIAVGGFVRALRIQQQLAAFVGANGNASLVIEQMAREIRTGHDFCANGMQCSSTSLAFTNARDEVVTYALDADRHALTRQVGTGDPAPVTSDTVVVRTLVFVVQFNQSNDRYPARVTVSMVIAPTDTNVGTSAVHLQTTVSARNLGT